MIDIDNSTEFEINISTIEKITDSLTNKDIELLVVKNDEIQALNKVHRNIDKPSQYVVVQDYVKWKPNLPSVDTTLIKDFYFIRKTEHLDSMKIKGTWIRLDEKGKVIDTILIK